MAVYLAVPAAALVSLVDDAIPPAARVLDLGCGVGRLANGLAARGHEVTGVDESAAMLAHLAPTVRAVRARIEQLDLGEAFDAVVLGSHLVNTARVAQRRAWLAACRRHLGAGGQVLLERHAPGTLAAPGETRGWLGPVEVRLQVHARRGDEVDATVVYRLDGREWRQDFAAEVLDDAALATDLAAVGLRLAGPVTDDGCWVRARRADLAP